MPSNPKTAFSPRNSCSPQLPIPADSGMARACLFARDSLLFPTSRRLRGATGFSRAALRPIRPHLKRVLATVGRTPLLRLERVLGRHHAAVFVKAENRNPLASVKDRIGLAMIEAAETHERQHRHCPGRRRCDRDGDHGRSDGLGPAAPSRKTSGSSANADRLTTAARPAARA